MSFFLDCATLPFLSGVYRIYFYSAGSREKMFPYYVAETVDVLIGNINDGALVDVMHQYCPQGRRNREYILGSDGKPHHVSLYYNPGIMYNRVLINTHHQPELPIFGQDYSPDALGLYMYYQGIPQTRENVLMMCGYRPDSHPELEKYQKNPELQKDLLLNYVPEMDQRSIIPKSRRMESAEDISNRHSDITDANMELIAQAEKSGKLVRPFIKDDMVNTPLELVHALELRGISFEDMSLSTLMKLGFVTDLRLIGADGKPWKKPISGVIIGLDDGSYQVRAMDFRNGNWEYRSKTAKAPRFTTIGPAMPFMFDDALTAVEAGDTRPLIITEGAFDAVSMDVASKGRVIAASTQGCQNMRYVTGLADRLAKTQTPVVIAFDADSPGKSSARDFARQLTDSNVNVYGWPGTLLDGGDMNDLLRNSPQAAKALMAFVRNTITLSETGILSPNMVNGIFGTELVSDSASSRQCADRMFQAVQEKGNTSSIEILARRSETAIRKSGVSVSNTPRQGKVL